MWSLDVFMAIQSALVNVRFSPLVLTIEREGKSNNLMQLLFLHTFPLLCAFPTN